MQKQMVSEKAWSEFRNAGLLWWINRSLHLFGWAIVFEIGRNGKVINVYPARVKFRGFNEKSENMGFLRLTHYLKRNSSKLLKEVV
jgi:hypothetical protein